MGFEWESDFWRDLMDDAYMRVPEHTEYTFEPDPVRSEYWTEDTLVGEIVEEESKALTGK